MYPLSLPDTGFWLGSLVATGLGGGGGGGGGGGDGGACGKLGCKDMIRKEKKAPPAVLREARGVAQSVEVGNKR